MVKTNKYFDYWKSGTTSEISEYYSANYDEAFDYMIINEGGYVNHPNDPGGETNFGISKKSYPYLNIKEITLSQAKEIYFVDFYMKLPYSDVCTTEKIKKLFDLSVNMGIVQSNKLLQRALRCCGFNNVVDDGIVGPITLKALSNCNDDLFLVSLCSEAAGFYRLLALTKPSNNIFLDGWLNRAYA